jgi:hypothetical protein
VHPGTVRSIRGNPGSVSFPEFRRPAPCEPVSSLEKPIARPCARRPKWPGVREATGLEQRDRDASNGFLGLERRFAAPFIDPIGPTAGTGSRRSPSRQIGASEELAQSERNSLVTNTTIVRLAERGNKKGCTGRRQGRENRKTHICQKDGGTCSQIRKTCDGSRRSDWLR